MYHFAWSAENTLPVPGLRLKQLGKRAPPTEAHCHGLRLDKEMPPEVI
jgi:hypothetical protein